MKDRLECTITKVHSRVMNSTYLGRKEMKLMSRYLMQKLVSTATSRKLAGAIVATLILLEGEVEPTVRYACIAAVWCAYIIGVALDKV